MLKCLDPALGSGVPWGIRYTTVPSQVYQLDMIGRREQAHQVLLGDVYLAHQVLIVPGYRVGLLGGNQALDAEPVCGDPRDARRSRFC